MLSKAWTSCWAWTNAPHSLHNLCNTWREALGHLLLLSSSLDRSSSAERLLFPADLLIQILPQVELYIPKNVTFYRASQGSQSQMWLQEAAKEKQANCLPQNGTNLKVIKRNLTRPSTASCSNCTPAFWNLCADKKEAWKKYIPVTVIKRITKGNIYSHQKFQLNLFLYSVLEDNSKCADTTETKTTLLNHQVPSPHSVKLVQRINCFDTEHQIKNVGKRWAMSHPSAQCLCVHEERTLDKVQFHD